MLQTWMEQQVLFYGMAAAGVLGVLCIVLVNHFYSRTIRDMGRLDNPRGKWTKEFLNERKMREAKEQEITNPEAFIRTQLMKGRVLGIRLHKLKQGIGLGALLCFLLMMTAVYGTYRYEQSQLIRYEYVLVGVGVFALLLLLRQFMGFMNKEDMILDGLMDFMENSGAVSQAAPDLEAIKEQTREELIERVTEGIRQTAASETKFSHLLTPEEETIMREVIREYLT